MADDDRAAKAARAKAMLKKRQQQKKAGTAPNESNAPSPPPSRPYTPASVPKSPEESAPPARDVSDLFGSADPQDTSWISGLQPAAPSPVATPPAPPQLGSPPLRASAGGPPLHATRPSISQASGRSSDGTMHALQAEKESMVAQMKETEDKLQEIQKLLQDESHRAAVLQEALSKLQEEKDLIGQNHQQTVSFLVSEKASLSEELQRLAGLEVEATNLRQQLEGEKNETTSLRHRLHATQDDLETASKDNERLNETEKTLVEKTREQERMLQVTNVTVSNLQKEVESAQRRYRELEEQIQSDDRLEKLEDTLRNTQDRTADLELQLSRQKRIPL
ncbi:hypothetical protein CYLTODRAFT_48383 [Cylindrobasidium torrendii FP15055 ss-10]|uniref:Uncharacterized protein n=1 Tax=Cylindrobasidium torrendii FP15055 ss-10 TaxID=1314674 RepID=A0A0D7B6Y2_9AGAR|nr:hypothetical protein CYLTODRAFT_48383 [Cylindrobasidium torrendii FP15055 ss-10]